MSLMYKRPSLNVNPSNMMVLVAFGEVSVEELGGVAGCVSPE